MNRKYLSSVPAALFSLALIASPAFSQGFTDAAAANLAKLGVQTPPIESMTTDQVAQITNVLSSTDSDTTKKQRIDNILGNDATATGRLGVAQLRDSAAADMAAVGLDTEMVDTLTLSQLGQIENVMSSNDADSVKKTRVEGIIGNDATMTGNLGVAQLQDSAAEDLASLGIDAEQVEGLTMSQLAQIENVMGSTVSDASKKDQIAKIVGE